MLSEPPKKRQRTFASFAPVTASGNSHVNQIGTLNSVNTYISTQAAASSQPEKSVETQSLASLLFNGIYSRKRNIDYTPGTCHWLLSHPQYQKWISNPGTVLWLGANPGTGKSALMKFAVQYEHDCKENTVTACSFFFNALGEKEESSTYGFFASLLHELSTQHQACLKAVTRAFEKNSELMGPFREKWQWTTKELKSLTTKILLELSTTAPVRIYVDAIDEAQNPDDVLDFLDDMLITDQSNLNICISCRHHPNLKRTPACNIDLGLESREDLEIHAKHMLRGLKASDERKTAVQELLVSHANRIFQWLVLVLPQVRTMLQDGESDSVVERKLHDVPAGLDALYTSLVLSIGEDHRQQSLKLFQWLCFGYGPLNVSEIRIALAFDEDDSWDHLEEFSSSKNEKWIDDASRLDARLKSLSKGLVCYVGRGKPAPHGSPEGRGTNVVFIHQSVQDFMKEKGLALLSKPLDRFQTSFEAGHTQLYRSCLKYMALCSWALPDYPKPEWIPRLHSKLFATEDFLALCEYSIFSWGRHAAELPSLTRSQQDEIIQLLNLPAIKLMERFILFDEAFFLYNGLDLGMSVLHMSAFLGLAGVVERLLSNEETAVDAQDNSRRTPLSWAARMGRTDAFRALIRRKEVDTHSQNVEGETPVNIAVEAGAIEMVQMLLEQEDFDPNHQSSHGLSPLAAAVFCDQIVVVRLLLSSGKVNVDVMVENKGSLLYMAAERLVNSSEICRLLLDTQKIDPNLGLGSSTPLHMAAQSGNIELVKLLTNTPQIQVEPVDEYGRTPLHYGAKAGSAEIVRVLVNAGGLNLMLRDNKGRTALHLAAKSGSGIVRLLLDIGRVDPLATDELGRTPLHLAAMKDNAEAVKLLLMTGLMHPMPVDALGNTPLFYALDLNCWSTIALLEDL